MIDAEWRFGNVFGALVDMGGGFPRVIDIVSNPIEYHILEPERKSSVFHTRTANAFSTPYLAQRPFH